MLTCQHVKTGLSQQGKTVMKWLSESVILVTGSVHRKSPLPLHIAKAAEHSWNSTNYSLFIHPFQYVRLRYSPFTYY